MIFYKKGKTKNKEFSYLGNLMICCSLMWGIFKAIFQLHNEQIIAFCTRHINFLQARRQQLLHLQSKK